MSASPPAFGEYWRMKQESSASKSLIFVQSDPSQLSSKAPDKTEESEQNAKNKRRAQVRKAQIQHRARKADYTKQLEADIAAIQTQIETAERARRELRYENQTIRSRLAGNLHPHHRHHHRQQQQQQQAQFTTVDGFYPGPVSTSYPQGLCQQSYGSDAGNCAAGLGGFYDVLNANMGEIMSTSGAYYVDNGSPAYASSSRGSSGDYLDSESNTPYPVFTQEAVPQAQLHQVLEYTSGFS